MNRNADVGNGTKELRRSRIGIDVGGTKIEGIALDGGRHIEWPARSGPTPAK